MHVRWSPTGLRRRVSYAGILALSALVVAPVAAQKATQTKDQSRQVRPQTADPGPTTPAQAGPERVDLDAIYSIKDEGLQRSRAMETLSFLTDVYGPRLTNSPGMRDAAEYAKKYMTEIGLTNARFEAWGPFGRGWANERTSVHVIAPQTWPAIAYPKAWTPGTNGPVTAEAVAATIDKRRRFRGLQGQAQRQVRPARSRCARSSCSSRHPAAVTRRRTSTEHERAGSRAARPFGRPADLAAPAVRRAGAEFRRKRMAFLVAEGAAAIIESIARHARRQRLGERAGSRPRRGLARAERRGVGRAAGRARGEHYNRILRTLNNKLPVTMEVNVQNKFYDADLNSFNVARGDSGRRQSRRDRDARLALRQLAWRDGRHRQRGELRRGHGGDAHPQGDRAEDAAHGARGALDRRGAGSARLARLREGALRRSRDDAAQARSTRSSRPISIRTTAAAPIAASTCRATKRSRRSSRRG